MSFETFPCGSPEAESPEEPAPSLYVENTDEEQNRLLIKKPVDSEPSRLAETANIEDKIMNEDEIAQVNASGGDGLKINTQSGDARSKKNVDRDDSARRAVEGRNMYDIARAHWVQLNYGNPATGSAHSLIPKERRQQQGDLSLPSGKNFDSGDRASVIIKRSKEQQEIESDSDNESQDPSKMSAKDSLRCNENISGVEANEDVVGHSRALYFNYNGHHEDVNKSQDKGSAKVMHGELLRGVSGEAKAVPIYYMPAGAYSHMVTMPGAATAGNTNMLQRDHFVHAGTNETKRFPMQQHVDYVSGRPEQQVPVATSSVNPNEGNVYGKLQHGGSAGIQYVDRRLMHAGGYAVVPGIGPVRVIDGMYYQGLPMGSDQSHYENFASVQSFIPMSNIPSERTATQLQGQLTTSSAPNADHPNQQSQEKLQSMCQVCFQLLCLSIKLAQCQYCHIICTLY